LAQEIEDDEKFKAILNTMWRQESDPDLRSLVTEIMLTTPKHVHVSATTTDSLPHLFRYDEIFQIPALLIVTPNWASIDRHWLHHVPQLKIKILENSCHFLHMKNPALLNKEVENFIADHALLEKASKLT
jgi:hypothetical protein